MRRAVCRATGWLGAGRRASGWAVSPSCRRRPCPVFHLPRLRLAATKRLQLDQATPPTLGGQKGQALIVPLPEHSPC